MSGRAWRSITLGFLLFVADLIVAALAFGLAGVGS